MEHTVYLGLGSNQGNRIDLLDQACLKINKLIGPSVRQSAYEETNPTIPS